MHNLDKHHFELCHQTLNVQQLNSMGMERNVVKENGGTVLYDANAVHMYCFDVYIMSAAIITSGCAGVQTVHVLLLIYDQIHLLCISATECFSYKTPNTGKRKTWLVRY